MKSIFISYRREDTEADAIAIKAKLDNALPGQVFMDKSLTPGSIWPEAIKAALEGATIVLAIIGHKWLTCHHPDGKRRIDDDTDWVRLELKTAINKNKTIIPVLIDGVEIPAEKSLPDDIRGLTRYQAVNLNRGSWDNDVNLLLERLISPQKKRAAIMITSTSPRRKALLKQIGWEEDIDYDTWSASVKLVRKTEGISLSTAQSITKATAEKKIRIVESDLSEIRKNKRKVFNREETVIVGVDTTVFCENKLLDRPLIVSIENANLAEIRNAQKKARKMLLEQRGQKVQIITCIAIALASEIENIKFKTVITEAKLRDYSQSDIDYYISSAEPFDKAGAFGIQEKGVSLFEEISGSYTNIVGLPLREFITLLQDTFGQAFDFPPLKSTLLNRADEKLPHLSTVAIGDINYDFIYDYLPESFFDNIKSPGAKEKGEIYRGAGGTAVNFAKGAQLAGFYSNCVVGVVGHDGLGRDIREELRDREISLLTEKIDVNQKTSIAVILRNLAREDISITLTDARQKLPAKSVERARETIESADVFYCSGYALIDENRREYAQEMLEIANKSGCIVIFDVVVGMSQEQNFSTYIKFKNRIKNAYNNTICVDILVSELKEILTWFNIDFIDGELSAWETNKDTIKEKLRNDFPVTIIRTSKYTHQIIITPNEVIGPEELDYRLLSAREKLGYGDIKTAHLVYEYLSPRVVLASKSPQRLQLLQQIMAPEKIQIQVSNINEDRVDKETPKERVKRLALAKAENILDGTDFGDTIEFIIGADTEIIGRKDENSKWDLIGHPKSISEAKNDLKQLSGKTHKAITGIAVIGCKPGSSEISRVVDCVETDVTLVKLDDDLIDSYANSSEPLNRAGAYAIQGLGSLLIDNITGSYSNVVGLPLERLSEIMAEKFEKPIWVFDKVSNWTKPNSLKKARKK